MPTTSSLPHAYFHKKILPFSEANISIASHSLQYGMTCFGGIRGYYRQGRIKIFRLPDHFQRLKNGAKILGIPFSMPYEEFKKIISDLIIANKPQVDIYIRPFLFSESLSLGPCFIGNDFDLAIYMLELHQYYASNKGLRLKISSWRKFSDDILPTKAKAGGCYLNSALATTEAREAGYDEALLLDKSGCVVETSVANIFAQYHDEIITPEVGENLLTGITRRTVVEIIQDEGLPLRFGALDRSMVLSCNELVITGTAVQIGYAYSIDGRPLAAEDAPGKLCQLLRSRFADIIEGRHPRSSAWLTDFTLSI